MPKYRTQTVYYPPEVAISNWSLGEWINQVRDSSEVDALLIKFVPRREADTSGDLGPGEAVEYTAIQGNVGSS